MVFIKLAFFGYILNHVPAVLSFSSYGIKPTIINQMNAYLPKGKQDQISMHANPDKGKGDISSLLSRKCSGYYAL